MSGSEHYLNDQAQIHTSFHRFTEIGQIFQNVSGTQEVDFASLKYYLGSMPRTPLEAFAFGTCFENRSLFIVDPQLIMVQLILFLSIQT